MSKSIPFSVVSLWICLIQIDSVHSGLIYMSLWEAETVVNIHFSVCPKNIIIKDREY